MSSQNLRNYANDEIRAVSEMGEAASRYAPGGDLVLKHPKQQQWIRLVHGATHKFLNWSTKKYMYIIQKFIYCKIYSK